LIEPVLELANVRLPAVLKNHPELNFGLFCGFDEGVGTGGADFDRLFREDVQALTAAAIPCAAWTPEGLPMITRSMGRCCKKASKF